VCVRERERERERESVCVCVCVCARMCVCLCVCVYADLSIIESGHIGSSKYAFLFDQNTKVYNEIYMWVVVSKWCNRQGGVWVSAWTPLVISKYGLKGADGVAGCYEVRMNRAWFFFYAQPPSTFCPSPNTGSADTQEYSTGGLSCMHQVGYVHGYGYPVPLQLDI